MRRCVASASPVDGGGRRVGGVRGPAACSGAVATPRRAGADRAVRPFQDRCRRLRRVRSPGGGGRTFAVGTGALPRGGCGVPRVTGWTGFSCCGARHCHTYQAVGYGTVARAVRVPLPHPPGDSPMPSTPDVIDESGPSAAGATPTATATLPARDARRGKEEVDRAVRAAGVHRGAVRGPAGGGAAGVGVGGELAGRGADGGDVLHRLPRHHDRLPPVLHARFVQGEASAADRAGRDGFAGGGGAPGAVGGRSPQAPQVLGRGG
ncbi:hypothetical protein SMICM304S_09113 [Streptomyces microflavus]